MQTNDSASKTSAAARRNRQSSASSAVGKPTEICALDGQRGLGSGRPCQASSTADDCSSQPAWNRNSGSSAPPPNLGNGASNGPAPVLQTLNISQGVSQGLLIKKVQPIYPSNALTMHVEGTVELLATVSTSGNITAVKVVSGDPQLTKAAADAVKQWKYKPYLLNGEPVEIQTASHDQLQAASLNLQKLSRVPHPSAFFAEGGDFDFSDQEFLSITLRPPPRTASSSRYPHARGCGSATRTGR